MQVEKYIKEILRLRREADALPDDVVPALMDKINYLSQCLVYVGRLSSYLDGEYKRIYAERKRVQAQAYVSAKGSKQAFAELAIVDHRMAEANAYEMMHRWRNAFDSTKEEIHALKLRMRIDFADGTVGDGNVRIQSGAKAAV